MSEKILQECRYQSPPRGLYLEFNKKYYMNWKTSDRQRKQYTDWCYDKIRIITNKELKDIKENITRFNIIWNDIEYLNADTIRDIYQSFDSENEALKECFIECLLNFLLIKNSDSIEVKNWEEYYLWSSAVIFFWLCKIWYVKDAVDYLCANKENNIATAMDLIYKLLEKDINYLSWNDLWNIQIKIQNLQDTWYFYFDKLKNELDNKITEIRFQEIRQKVNSNNIEINNDKKKVQEYLKNFWFEELYNKVLTDVDKYLNSWDEILLASAIWSFREFFKFFYIDLAKKIATINWLDKIPENEKSTTEIWHAREYIKKEFNLSSEEKNFFDNYKDITTNNWAHALVKESRYFRLARNIWIEIALFHLSKYEDYIKLKTSPNSK